MRQRFLGLALVVSAVACSPSPAPSGKPGFDILSVMPIQLLRQANGGREVLRENGAFAFPKGVRRVWIDVGAHYLETTQAAFLQNKDLGLIAIEPMDQCWRRWPASDRLIALPVAIFVERGQRDFNVNAHDATSSLAKGMPGAPLEAPRKTVEVRSVPVLRLEDVLERIPAELEITFLKTDVQSLDLQVLRSGGEQLRRVFRVKTEVINDERYQDVDGEGHGTEKEFVEYMGRMGFVFTRDLDVAPDRLYLDKEFVNVNHPRYTW